MVPHLWQYFTELEEACCCKYEHTAGMKSTIDCLEPLLSSEKYLLLILYGTCSDFLYRAHFLLLTEKKAKQNHCNKIKPKTSSARLDPNFDYGLPFILNE